jgi:transposase
VEDYKEIRQMYLSGKSQRQIAKKLNISRNTVAKYCEGSSVPWERKSPERINTVLTKEIIDFIQECFNEDEKEHLKKQYHTAKRIYDRLVVEKGFAGGESTIRAKVKEMKGSHHKVFVPLVFSPGEAMQVDWGVAKIYLNGKRVEINLFCARLCYSCAPIVFAYHRQNQESFLEAFVRTFNFFGGVSEKVIFDNAKVAVKKGFGINAQKQASYTALSAHYGFDALFCNPAEGHEKGLVEGLVGWARRNILVPVPKVKSLSELNQMLENRCIEYRTHRIRGKKFSVGKILVEEKDQLRPLPGYEFETAKCSSMRVNTFSTVRFDSNDYSVPTNYCGSNVSVKGSAETITIYYQGKTIASHNRCFSKYSSIYALEHYLPILDSRKRAIFNAAPVIQNLPTEFLNWLKENTSSHKDLMEVLWMCAEHGWKNVWHNSIPKIGVPVNAPLIEVDSVNLEKYDSLVPAIRSAVCH